MEDVNPDLNKVEEFGPLLDETRQIQSQRKWIRLGFVVIILATIAGWTWSTYTHFETFDMEEFGTEVAKKAERSWPMLADEADKVWKSVIPIARASLEKELEDAAPKIGERFEAEAKLLDDNLKKGIRDSMKTHLVLKERADAMKVIQGAFPSFANEKAMDELAAALQESFLQSTEKQLLGMLVEYYETLKKFEKAFRKIKADIPEGQRPATMEAVLGLWIELVYEKMGGDSEFEANAPDKGKRKGRK